MSVVFSPLDHLFLERTLVYADKAEAEANKEVYVYNCIQREHLALDKVAFLMFESRQVLTKVPWNKFPILCLRML